MHEFFKNPDHNACLKRPLILKVFYWKRFSCLFVTKERNRDNLFSEIQLPAQQLFLRMIRAFVLQWAPDLLPKKGTKAGETAFG